jgi:hypothetical protein
VGEHGPGRGEPPAPDSARLEHARLQNGPGLSSYHKKLALAHSLYAQRRSVYPSYCCQRCGATIGWLGRGLEIFLPTLHDCPEKYRPTEFDWAMRAVLAAIILFSLTVGTMHLYNWGPFALYTGNMAAPQ